MHDTRTAVPPSRAVVLTAGTFAVGTDAFVVAGVLPDLARSLHVGVAEAAQLVTVFALAYAALAPVLATLTGGWPRRKLLLTALLVFVAGNVATALAPSYALVVATRVLAAAGAAMFTPHAAATAAALAPPEQRARAICGVVFGLTSSTALGAPVGTFLASVLSWRETIWFVATLGGLSALAVARWLPDVPAPPAVSLRERLSPLGDSLVIWCLAVTLAMFVGIYVPYTYASVVLGPATGGDGAVLAGLLFVSGCAGMVSTPLSGRLTDRIGPRRVIATAAGILLVTFALLPVANTTVVGAGVGMAAYGFGAWAVNVPQQHRLIALRPSAASLVVALNASALYLAVSLSGLVGAGVLHVTSATALPWVAAAFVAAGLLASERLHRRFARPRTSVERVSAADRQPAA